MRRVTEVDSFVGSKVRSTLWSYNNQLLRKIPKVNSNTEPPKLTPFVEIKYKGDEIKYTLLLLDK